MIEITHAASRYTYKIEADSPRVIQRRSTRKNSRYTDWRLFSTADEAKRELLRLERESKDEAE